MGVDGGEGLGKGVEGRTPSHTLPSPTHQAVDVHSVHPLGGAHLGGGFPVVARPHLGWVGKGIGDYFACGSLRRLCGMGGSVRALLTHTTNRACVHNPSAHSHTQQASRQRHNACEKRCSSKPISKARNGFV